MSRNAVSQRPPGAARFLARHRGCNRTPVPNETCASCGIARQRYERGVWVWSETTVQFFHKGCAS